MRRSLFAALFLALIFLSSCGLSKTEDDIQPAIDFRAKLLNAGGASFIAEVIADYGDEVYSFTLDCTYSSDGTTQITVLLPETISGITAKIENDSGTVSFGETELTFGTLADDVVTPLAAPAVVGRSWQSAYIAAAGKEEKSCRISYEDGYEADKLCIDTWFSAEGIPIYSEICYHNNCILRMNISNFQFIQ